MSPMRPCPFQPLPRSIGQHATCRTSWLRQEGLTRPLPLLSLWYCDLTVSSNFVTFFSQWRSLRLIGLTYLVQADCKCIIHGVFKNTVNSTLLFKQRASYCNLRASLWNSCKSLLLRMSDYFFCNNRTMTLLSTSRHGGTNYPVLREILWEDFLSNSLSKW